MRKGCLRPGYAWLGWNRKSDACVLLTRGGQRPVRRREFGYGPMLYQHMAERQRPREITIAGNPVVPGNLI